MSMIKSILEQKVSIKEIIIVAGILGIVFIIVVAVLFYTFGGVKEGFRAGWRGVGAALDYNIGDGVKVSWENKDLEEKINEITPTAEDNTDIYSNLESNTGGPIPLKEGEMLIFEENKFSPDCCPADYSNSSGCVCASPEQANYLNERGGNRTLVDMF